MPERFLLSAVLAGLITLYIALVDKKYCSVNSGREHASKRLSMISLSIVLQEFSLPLYWNRMATCYLAYAAGLINMGLDAVKHE